MTRYISLLAALVLLPGCHAFSSSHVLASSKLLSTDATTRTSTSTRTSTQLQASRRESLQKMAFGISSILIPSSAIAADKEPTIYKSGKAPIVPGQKPQDKSDNNGTRRDGNFLRSISNCKTQCESTNGPDGYARSKEECLSDCQDICCTTYEQCTFGIVPRI